MKNHEIKAISSIYQTFIQKYQWRHIFGQGQDHLKLIEYSGSLFCDRELRLNSLLEKFSTFRTL